MVDEESRPAPSLEATIERSARAQAQAAQLLRRHGGTPLATDFILWLATRPEP